MPRTNFQELLDAGVHFGHLKRKWNPAMAPYIFMEKNGIHLIDLQKTIVKVDEAANAIKQIAKSGRKVLFVATKKQAKEIVAETVGKVNMPYVTERWPGGMLTNFPTIRKAVKKMISIDKMMKDSSWDNLSKREKLQIGRQRAKLEKVLGSIADLTRLPAALFIVDVLKERIAVREAQRLGIPVFGMVDTNSDPEGIDFVIPSNDDASQSIRLIVRVMADAIAEGLNERKVERDKESDEEAVAPKKTRRADVKKSAAKFDVDEEEDIESDIIDEEVEEEEPEEVDEDVEDIEE
ncbi:MAG: 30S ribosomal protein S2 [Mangrovibacterium sp.]|jgi:small subunit ribosomal protein S2